jgi:small GTP-binding protein
MDASEADTTTLRESITVLDSLFLCCVLGEFNAGKSALLNALLGGNHCGEGVLPTTAALTLIKHPSVPFEPSHAQSEVEVLDIPRSWLRGLHLVDTPGTNSIEDAHTALTQGFLPRADLVLFVTSAERPFSQSEQELLRAVADWRKPVLCVLNKADLLDATQLHTVSEYVAAQARLEP